MLAGNIFAMLGAETRLKILAYVYVLCFRLRHSLRQRLRSPGDIYGIHYSIMVGTYLMAFLARGAMAFAPQFAAVLVRVAPHDSRVWATFGTPCKSMGWVSPGSLHAVVPQTC